VQRVIAQVPTTNETHDVAGVDDVPEENRWFDWFQCDVAVLERSQNNHPATGNRTDEGHATRDRCTNFGTGGCLNVDTTVAR